MQIYTDEQLKLVKIWLSKKERSDVDLQEKLKPLDQDCKSPKYCVAVFESGDGDLLDNTRTLLCCNYSNPGRASAHHSMDRAR